MIMAKKMYLKTILDKKDCWGIVIHTKNNHYFWQTDNDMGFYFGTDWDYLKEEGWKETFLRKIEVIKGKYLYVLKNNGCFGEEQGDCTTTLTTIKALIKECHKGSLEDYGLSLTKHEQMLVDRYYDYESLKYCSTTESKLPF